MKDLRLLEDTETLRDIRQRELKAAILEGIDSEDAGSIEEVVAGNRARRGQSSASSRITQGGGEPTGAMLYDNGVTTD